LGLHAGVYKKLVSNMAQRQGLVEVWADFEWTVVNRALDKWSKQAFVKAKGEHFEHSLFMMCCIVWTDEMFQMSIIINEDRRKLHC